MSRHGPGTSASRPRWQLLVSALLAVWLGAQFVAGWKFANAQTYPVVGSAMFNGPPVRDRTEFLVPRVFARTSTGERVELDDDTFGLEPFEWRRWLRRNIQDVPEPKAQLAARRLADEYESLTHRQLTTMELWHLPARTDDFERGRFIRAVEL